MGKPANSANHDVFVGDSEMAKMMRDHDWASTPLGPPDRWPEGLKVALRLLLTSKFEMWLGWGDDIAFFYNDAYRPTLGAKHPKSLGAPAAKLWAEIWPDIAPRIQKVYQEGESTWDRALLLLLNRNGFPEETYHTFSYSPLFGDSGKVEGVFCAVSEETERVISERRMHTLRELSGALNAADTRAEVFDSVHETLGRNTRDLPFTLVYLFDEPDANLILSTGGIAGHEIAPTTVNLDRTDLWGAQAILAGERSVKIDLAPTHGLPSGAWDQSPREAIVFPLAAQGRERPAGFLVAAANAHRPIDVDFAGFIDLIAGQIAAGLANADAHQAARAEAAARASERDRLYRLFEQAPAFLIAMRGPEHVVEFVNNAHRRLFGSHNWVGKTMRDAFPSIAGQGFYELLDRVYATGVPYEANGVEVRYKRSPEGPEEARRMTFIYAPVYEDDGAITGIFCEGFDVTDAHHASIALRENEERYRALFENIDAAFCIVEVIFDDQDRPIDHRFIEINPAFEQQSGMKNALGRSAREILPEHEQHWFDTYGRIVKTGEAARFENGSDALGRWFDVHAMRVGPAEQRRVAILFNDITERKKTEDRLRHLNETLEYRVAEAIAGRKVLADIVEGTDAFVQVADRDYRWLAINKASADEFERIYGVRPSVGQSMLDLLADRPEHRESVRQVWERALNGEAFTEIGEYGDRGHDRRSYEMKFNVLRDGAGAMIGAYQFVYDVTERVREQRRLAEAEEALRQSQKMEIVGQLTGGIAHDFNNLLMAVLSNLDMLRRNAPADPRLMRLIDGAEQGAKRGAALTQRLLAFARRQSLTVEPASIGELVEGMRELLTRSVGPEIELRFHTGAELPVALVDPNQIELALLNLVVNARDAMPNGGVIEIATNDVNVRGATDLADGAYVRLCVTDTGVGMDEETLKRAIEPFFSTKELGKGTGLGLSMIHGLASQLNGALRLTSTPGKGARAELFLPVTTIRVADKVAVHVVPPEPRAARRLRVLVVDDDPLIAMSTTDMLTDLGHEIMETNSAAAALDVLRSGQAIDFMLTDFAMPGMNGAELAKAARDLRPNLPILLATGYAEMPKGVDIELARLGKPYSQDQLAREIERLFAGQREPASSSSRSSSDDYGLANGWKGNS